MIDTYEGKVFNVVLSDVPEKKNDLILSADLMAEFPDMNSFRTTIFNTSSGGISFITRG
jgi:hypothetical protein